MELWFPIHLWASKSLISLIYVPKLIFQGIHTLTIPSNGWISSRRGIWYIILHCGCDWWSVIIILYPINSIFQINHLFSQQRANCKELFNSQNILNIIRVHHTSEMPSPLWFLSPFRWFIHPSAGHKCKFTIDELDLNVRHKSDDKCGESKWNWFNSFDEEWIKMRSWHLFWH